jgi:hypothetical protein
MSTTPSPFVDHAAPLLAGEPSITDDQRADLHDIFHGSKDPAELTQKLLPLDVPDDLKQQLVDKKKLISPVTEPVDKVAAAMEKMKALDPQTLELAESHPNVLKVMTAAATTPDKESAAPAGASPAPAKGKASGKVKTSAPLALPPRVDGLQHLPPIPDGHRRILASDGGIHDLPDDKINDAFSIDPRLHVMNP